MSQQHACVPQGRICSENSTCCHTEKEVADQSCYVTHSQYADTWPTSPSTELISPGAWQGSYWMTKKILNHRYNSIRKNPYWRGFVCWLLNVPATCECISGTDLLRQLYVLPHRDRSCRPNFLPHPVTVYWHRADQSQRWPYNARRLAG